MWLLRCKPRKSVTTAGRSLMLTFLRYSQRQAALPRPLVITYCPPEDDSTLMSTVEAIQEIATRCPNRALAVRYQNAPNARVPDLQPRRPAFVRGCRRLRVWSMPLLEGISMCLIRSEVKCFGYSVW